MARRSRGASAKGKSLVWTSVATANEDVSDATQELDIVQSADWNVAAGRKSATLLSIRGYITMRRALANRSDVLMYIAKYDEDETSASPLLASTYVDEDILWTGGYSNPPGGNIPYTMEINIKAKRRISSGDDIRLVFIEDGVTNTMFLTCVLRALINTNNG